MVGLTGGIGSGKSAVAARLAEHGAIVIDADTLAREAVAQGTEGLAEVVAAFGPGVLAADGGLDRPALGRLVFGDDVARRRLEGIIHPRVRARTAELAEAAPPDAVVVNDVPLLVEAGLGSARSERQRAPQSRPESGHAGGFDLVVVVLAAEQTRVRRLVSGRGMSEQEARSRIAAQATDEQRRAVADVVLTNDGSLDELHRQVDELWQDRLVAGSSRPG
jgi:dephospho-CoA kinase